VLCAPDGYVMGVWGPWKGSTPDDKAFGKEIERSREIADRNAPEEVHRPDGELWEWISNYSAAGGALVADAGFPDIKKSLPEGMIVYAPQKAKVPRNQVELEAARKVTTRRGVVERVNARLKHFSLLRHQFPNNKIPHSNIFWSLAAALSNLWAAAPLSRMDDAIPADL